MSDILQPAKQREFAPSWLVGAGAVKVDETGQVFLYYANSTYPRLLTVEQFEVVQAAVQEAFSYVAHVRAEKERFSRDELRMFELLQPWQQWALLVQMHNERMGVTV